MTGMVPLVGTADKKHAGRIERLAFKHGKAGVGHVMWHSETLERDGSTRLFRTPRVGDPGQPKGWDLLVPFGHTLKETILYLGSYCGNDAGLCQALIFEEEAEAQSFLAEFGEVCR
jgi:hypothetical protein